MCTLTGDASIYVGNGVGHKRLTSRADWIVVSDLERVGQTEERAVVTGNAAVTQVRAAMCDVRCAVCGRPRGTLSS